MRAVVIAILMMVGPAWAEGWTVLDGAGIEAALSGRSLDYGTATQDFRASGITDYVASRPTTGQWAVRGDQYCSVWPPSDSWSCYDVDVSSDGSEIRFRGAGGDETVGVYK